MQINDDESNTGTDGEGVDIGSDGELNAENPDNDRKTGPWKKMSENATETAPAVVEKQTASKVYISPAMRMAQVKFIYAINLIAYLSNVEIINAGTTEDSFEKRCFA